MIEEPKLSTKYVVVESNPGLDQDEIDLFELIRTIMLRWKTVVVITGVCLSCAFVYAQYAPRFYKAKTLLAPASEESSGVSSALSEFGGLAVMAGVSIPNDSDVDQVLATLQSRKFLRHYINSKKLQTILFEEIWDSKNQVWIVETEEDEPTEQGAVDAFRSILSVHEDKKSRLISLSISWKDPAVAAEWANDLVKLLNEQLQEKAIIDSKKRIGYLEQELAKTTLQDMRAVLYNLLESEKQKAMLASVNEDFALEVIDPAVAPEIMDKPRSKLIVALGGLCGGFLGVFVVFFGQFLQKLKSPTLKKK